MREPVQKLPQNDSIGTPGCFSFKGQPICNIAVNPNCGLVRFSYALLSQHMLFSFLIHADFFSVHSLARGFSVCQISIHQKKERITRLGLSSLSLATVLPYCVRYPHGGFVPSDHDLIVQAFRCACEMLHVASSMSLGFAHGWNRKLE